MVVPAGEHIDNAQQGQPVDCRRATPAEYPAALGVLLQDLDEPARSDRVADLLQQQTQGQETPGTFTLTDLWVTNELDAAILTVPQPDGMWLVWPPAVRAERVNPLNVQRVLLKQLTRVLDAAGAAGAQILAAAEPAPVDEVLRSAGFTTWVELSFLAWSLATVEQTAPANVASASESRWRRLTWSQQPDPAVWARAIAATYVGSADCPALSGRRTAEQALAVHQTTGEFWPDGWWMYYDGCEPAGLLLMNDHRADEAVEVVYTGVLPAYRGRGLGRLMLTEALQGARAHQRLYLCLAVDASNTYATSVYHQMGGVEWLRRRAAFRFLPTLARK